MVPVSALSDPVLPPLAVETGPLVPALEHDPLTRWPIETFPMVDTSATALAQLLLAIIENDRVRLRRVDRYVSGDHDDPYMPTGADAEYRLLARRAVTNLIPLLVGTPAQALYVDSFRRAGAALDGTPDSSPEWDHWQNSRLDFRQIPIHRGALKYGHAFALTERVAATGRVITKGLSAFNTAAVYEDPANDVNPYAALTVVREPNPGAKNAAARQGVARLWDGTYEYRVTFESYMNPDSVSVSGGIAHGLSECPVTRFAASIDLEGRTVGVVEPNIADQDRINQTVFDLLVAQTYGSFAVRTITGMAPPIARWSETTLNPDPASRVPVVGPNGGVINPPADAEPGDPIVDDQGKPIPLPINLNARRWFFAEDDKAKFGSLPGTSLDGYIKSLDMSLRHLAVSTQTPPHYLLGEIANLSAEALQAAETALLRKVEEFKKSFGESWERVFRLARVLSGETDTAEGFQGEVVWRDTQMRSLSSTADALVKLRDVGIPAEGLLHRVPEATRTEILEWLRLREQERERLRQERMELLAAGGTVDTQFHDEELP